MSRIKGLSRKKAGWATRCLFRMAERMVGKLVEPLQVTAHHSRLLWGMSLMEGAQQASKQVDATLKELAQIKVAMLVGCPF